jgi:hypothetical protein
LWGEFIGDSTVQVYQLTKETLKDADNMIAKAVGADKEEPLDEEEIDLSHIVVFSKNELIAASFIGYLERNDVQVPIVTFAEWLDVQLITYEQFRRRHFYFIYPKYINLEKPAVKRFRKDFYRQMRYKPVSRKEYSVIAFDMLVFWGEVMHEYGNIFHQPLHKRGYATSPLMHGFQFSKGNANEVVPIYTFDDNYELIWVNKP